jgi:hypothetical protein
MSLRFALAGDDYSSVQVHSRFARSEHGRFEAIETVVNPSRSHKSNNDIDRTSRPKKFRARACE